MAATGEPDAICTGATPVKADEADEGTETDADEGALTAAEAEADEAIEADAISADPLAAIGDRDSDNFGAVSRADISSCKRELSMPAAAGFQTGASGAPWGEGNDDGDGDNDVDWTPLPDGEPELKFEAMFGDDDDTGNPHSSKAEEAGTDGEAAATAADEVGDIDGDGDVDA